MHLIRALNLNVSFPFAPDWPCLPVIGGITNPKLTSSTEADQKHLMMTKSGQYFWREFHKFLRDTAPTDIKQYLLEAIYSTLEDFKPNTSGVPTSTSNSSLTLRSELGKTLELDVVQGKLIDLCKTFDRAENGILGATIVLARNPKDGVLIVANETDHLDLQRRRGYPNSMETHVWNTPVIATEKGYLVGSTSYVRSHGVITAMK